MSNFAKILKDQPFEIAKASRDAQKISNLLLGVSLKREQKQGAGNTAGFQKGDEVNYLENTYKIIDTYKSKNIKVEDASGNRKIVKPTDGLYSSLLEAKNNPREPEMVLEEEQGQSHENEQKQKIGR